jgi:sugar-specific transcriptional regulator TrmB
MEELKKILNDLGLSSYKSRAYLGLLKIKSGTIQQIAKNSSVPSCKLYEILKWLHEQGYITMILQKPVTYSANDPEIVIRDELAKKERNLKDIESQLGKLNFKFQESDKDAIQITNNKQSFIRKMKETLNNSKGSVDYIIHNWSTDSEIFRISRRMIKNGVKIRVLGPVNEKNLDKVKWSVEAGIEVRNFTPKTTHFSIFDKRIVIVKLRKNEEDPISIWIKSEVLAEILQDYFNSIWKISKKYKITKKDL